MRKTAFIIGLFGALCALALGLKWMSDLNSDLGLISQQLVDKGVKGDLASEFKGLKTATYLLILCGVTGIVFSILTLVSRVRKEINGIILITAGVLPLFFSGKALFGVPMVLAGILAFAAKPRTVPVPAVD